MVEVSARSLSVRLGVVVEEVEGGGGVVAWVQGR